jgi:hypothetical protein
MYVLSLHVNTQRFTKPVGAYVFALLCLAALPAATGAEAMKSQEYTFMNTTLISVARATILGLTLTSLAQAGGTAQAEEAVKPGADLFVSPAGDDTHEGTLQRPLQTLEQARQAVRELKARNQGELPVGGVRVWLRGGRYELRQTFLLAGKDSGQEGRPVAYCAYGDESPVLSGGRMIRGWQRVEGDLAGRLPAAAVGKVWAAAVPEAKDGGWPFRQLWLNGKRLARARWPNAPASGKDVAQARPTGDNYRDNPVLPGMAKLHAKHAMNPFPTPAMMADRRAHDDWRAKTWNEVAIDDLPFPQGDLPADIGDPSVELFAKNAGHWATMRIPIAKTYRNVLVGAVPFGCLSFYWGGMRLMVGDMGYLENALSLLDQAGEWYLDRKSGTVYYLPAEDEDPSRGEFVAAKLETLVQLRGTPEAPVQYVELRGLHLEHAEWPMPAIGYRPALGCAYGTELTPLVADVPCKSGSTRPKDEFPEYWLPAAVDLVYARECLLEGCQVSRVGATGIGLAEGCQRNRILGCEVFDAGGHGIHVGLAHGPICGEDFGWKSPEDEPQSNEVVNCYVHHTGEMDWGAYGIFSSYCQGTRIAHNLVEQQPYSGITPCFTWFAFPSGRDYDVKVEYNHVRHVLRKLMDGGGIYSKDGMAKTSIMRGNLIHDVGGQTIANNAIFLDDGSYGFHLTENMFYHVQTAIRFNNTSKDKFTWGTNYEGETAIPPELRAKAGPEEPYRGRFYGKPQGR